MAEKLRFEKALIRKKAFLFSAFFFIPFLVAAHLDFNHNCQLAYKNILSLRFPDAQILIKKERADHPGNLACEYLENYIDFLGAFIKEEDPLLTNFNINKENRMKTFKREEPQSPYYHYCLGNLYLQSAILHTKFQEYKSAAFDYQKAYKEFQEEEKDYPAFLPNQSGLGFIHILIGVIPDNYKWLTRLFGMNGDVKTGLAEISKVASYTGEDPNVQLFRLEALFYLSFMDSSLGNDAGNAVKILTDFEQSNPSFPDHSSPLWVFTKATILARSHRNEEVNELLDRYRQTTQVYRFAYLDYLTGLAKLNRLDPSAGAYFQSFLKDFKGRNYIKSAYQKLAWCSLIGGEIGKYKEIIRNALTKGDQHIEGDRQAYQEAAAGMVPNNYLLRARLLDDGGYYDRALHELLDRSVKEIVLTNRDLVEYQYRLGRIYQDLGDVSKALSYFDKTIQQGGKLSFYFAANAALQSGLIFEHQKDFQHAEKYYRICLNCSNTEYKTSLDQKAKAGLQRLRKP